MADDDSPLTGRPRKAGRSEVATSEKGYAAVPTGAGWWQVGAVDDETTPELRWPDCLRVYDAMRKQDAQVGSVLRAVTFPIRSTTWRIDPNGAPDHVVEHVAQDLGLPIKGREDVAPGRTRDRFSWGDHLRHALLQLVFGHMVFEQVYRISDDGTQAHLRKLAPRMPRTIQEFEVARDGGLVAVRQYAPGGLGEGQRLLVNRLVVYVHEREAGNWQGASLLRQAYKNWLLKDRLMRTQTTAIDRNGMGIPVYTAAEPGNRTPAEVDAELDDGQQLAEDARSGDNSGLALPNGADFELLGVQGQTPDASKPIQYHDEQIARAVLAHFLNLGTQTGSWALGSTFEEFFTQSLTAVAQEIADVTTAHVIEDLVDINYGEDMPAPRLVFDDIGSNAGALALAIKTLVDAGVLTPDEGTEAHMRLVLGLPTKTQGDDRDDSAA